MALSPFDSNGSSNSSYIGGSAADKAFGMPGLSKPPIGSFGNYKPVQPTMPDIGPDTAPVQQQAPLKAPVAHQGVVGYNPQTGEVYSAGHIIPMSNATLAYDYMQRGAFKVSNNPNTMPAGFSPVESKSFEDYLTGVAQNGRGIGDDAKQVGRSFVDGAVNTRSDFARIGGDIAGGIGATGASDYLNNKADSWDANRQPEDLLGRSKPVKYASEVAGSLGSIAPALAAGAVLGPEASAGIMAAQFGDSQYHNTYKTMIAHGASEEDARTAALGTGALTGVGTAAFGGLTSRLMQGGTALTKGLLNEAAPTVESAIASRINPSWGKDFLHGQVEQQVAGNALMAGQTYGNQAIEKSYGNTDADPTGAALDSIKLGLGMNAAMAPLGALANRRAAIQRGALGEQLKDSSNPVDALKAGALLSHDITPDVGFDAAHNWYGKHAENVASGFAKHEFDNAPTGTTGDLFGRGDYSGDNHYTNSVVPSTLDTPNVEAKGIGDGNPNQSSLFNTKGNPTKESQTTNPPIPEGTTFDMYSKEFTNPVVPAMPEAPFKLNKHLAKEGEVAEHAPTQNDLFAPEPKPIKGAKVAKSELPVVETPVTKIRDAYGISTKGDVTNNFIEEVLSRKEKGVITEEQAHDLLDSYANAGTNGNQRNKVARRLQDTKAPVVESTEVAPVVATEDRQTQLQNVIAGVGKDLPIYQHKVFEYFKNDILNGDGSKVLNEKNQKQTTAIANALGIEKGNVSSAITQIKAKLVKLYGKDVFTNKTKLGPDATDTDRLGLSPAEQKTKFDVTDLATTEDGPTVGFGVTAHPTHFNVDRTSVTSNNTHAQSILEKTASELLASHGKLEDSGNAIVPHTEDPVHQARVEEAVAKRNVEIDFLLQSEATKPALESWHEYKKPNDPLAKDLTKEDAHEWVTSYIEFKNGDINEETHRDDLREIASRYNDSGREKSTASENLQLEQSVSSDKPGKQSNDTKTPSADSGGIGTRTTKDGFIKLGNGLKGLKDALDGNELSSKGRPLTFKEMHTGGINDALNAFESHGLFDIAFKHLHNIVEEKLPEGQGLFVPLEDGKFIVKLDKGLLDSGDSAYISHVVRHELSHALDYKFGWVFSDHSRMQVHYEDGKINGIGSVSKEIIDLYNSTSAAGKLEKGLKQYFSYPLDLSEHSKEQLNNIDTSIIQAELFAQAQAAWMTPEGKQVLKIFLPKTFKYLQEANDYAKNKLQTHAARESSGDANKNIRGYTERSGQTFGLQNGNRFQRDLASKGKQLDTSDPENIVYKAASHVGGHSGRLLATDATHIATKLGESVKSLSDLVKDYSTRLPSIRGWHDGLINTIKTRRALESNAEQIAADAGKLPSTTTLNKFIEDSTTQKKWGYGTNADPEMAKRFNALSDKEKGIAKAIFDHGIKMLDEKRQTLSLLGLKGMFNGTPEIDGPYAPLKRFGNYVSVLKSKELLHSENNDDTSGISELRSNPNHYLVSHFDTMGQAKEFAKLNDKTNGGDWDHTYHFEKNKEVVKHVPTQILEKVMAVMKVDDSIPVSAREAVVKLVSDMYFQSIDEQHARTSGLKRKNVAGANPDMVRSFLAGSRAEANFLANIKHGGEVNENFYRMKQEAKIDKYENNDEFNLIAAHYADSLARQDTPIQDRIMAFTSAFQLATSVGYHLTNALQPTMVTIPRLAADFNDYAGAWKHLWDGYKLIGTTGWKSSIDPSKVKDVGLRGMLQDAVDSGLLNGGMLDDLSHYEATHVGINGIDNASKLARNALFLLRKVSTSVENANRVSAGAAAYTMAIKHGKSVEQAHQYAIDVIRSTQGDTSRLNKPLLLKKLPKIVGQYRSYQFMMAALYSRAFKDAFMSEDPATRAIGRRMLGYKLFHTSVAAGALGLPMINMAAFAYNNLADDSDEPKDFERDLRSLIGDDTLADLLTHGPVQFLGLDMSAKLGDDKIFSPLPYTDVNFTSASDVAKTAAGAMGPAVSQAGKFANGIGYMKNGEYYKGVEQLMPSGVANGMKAFRIANDGYTLKNGDTLYSPENINGMSMALDALGLPSAQMKHMDYIRNSQYEIEKFYSDKTRGLKADYIRAYREKDNEKLQEIRSDWQALQDGKQGIRKYFNNDPVALRIAPISNLYKAPFQQDKANTKLQREAY